LFQLENTGTSAAEVLYIVSPAYVFEMDDGKIVHDDAVLVAESWDELPASMDDTGVAGNANYEAWAGRTEAKRRLAKRKGVEAPRLTGESVRSLPIPYDYLAPDGSEIRLLIGGEHGGLAHCLLPAGRASSPVQHRTVEELWHVLEGEGEIWRARNGEERCDKLQPGDSIRICVDTCFQFRAGKAKDLKLLLATMPPWPGPQDAVAAPGKWPLSGAK
jgi:mannose-6-phosphate isomerase-like protein (cupin superfamily)